MTPARVKRWLVALGAYFALSLALGFFPNYGPPHFRYTGFDPDRNVWNLGWPLATMIWDSGAGIHVGPWAYALFSMILLVFAGCAIAFALQVAYLRMKRVKNIGS